MSNFETILILCIIIQCLAVYYLVRDNKKLTDTQVHMAEVARFNMDKVKEYDRRSGFKQYQIDMLRKQILIEDGKDLNEMQIISILIAWRDTYEAIGREKEFISNYIKERGW